MLYRPFLTRLTAFICLLAVGCYNRDLDPVLKQGLSVDASGNATPANWKKCQTTYWTIGGSSAPFSASQTAAVAEAFVEYTNVGSTLRFEKRDTQASITVIPAPAATFTATPTPGLISYSLPSVSYYTVDGNKNAIIYINADAALTPAQIKAVLMHQIGKLMGLPLNSSDEGSVMHAPDLNKPLKSLSKADIDVVLNQFGTECPVLVAGTDNLAERIFDNRCGGIPYFIEQNKTIYNEAKLNAAGQWGATLWNGAGTFVQFRATNKPDSALVRIRFAPKEEFKESQVSDGTVSLIMLPLSKLQKGTAPGTAVILLRQDVKWNENTLRQAITQQMGYYLGMQRSTDPASIMYLAYRPELPLTTLSADDKTKLAGRFGADCPLQIVIDAAPLKLPGVKYFGRRMLTYRFSAANGLTVPDWTTAAVTDAFKSYTNANFLHQFAPIATTDLYDPTFSITFVPASITGKNVVAKVKYNEIGGMDGYSIQLNWEATTWTQPRLQAALSHVIGAVLGLPISTDENDLMFGTLKSANPRLSPTDKEVTALKALYLFNKNAQFCPVAPAFMEKMNTQNVPNCIVRSYYGIYNSASISHDSHKAMTLLNANLPTTRFAYGNSPNNNYTIAFLVDVADEHLNTLLTERPPSNRLSYSRLSYLNTSTNETATRYFHHIRVNANESQLKVNNGAGLINLELYWMGRLMGLPDSDDPASIMYPYVSTTVKTPTADDAQKLRTAFGPCEFGPVAAGWRKAAENVNFGMGFVFGDRVYTCSGSQVYRTDITNRQSTLKATMPGNFYNYAAFASADKLYLVGGHRQPVNYGRDEFQYDNALYEFNPATEQLNKIATFPGQSRTGAVGLTFDGKCYIGGGYYNKLQTNSKGETFYTGPYLNDAWLLDLKTGQWTQQEATPTFSSTSYSRTLIYTGKGYAFLGGSANFVYTPSSDSWSTLPQLPNNGGIQAPWQMGDYVYGLGAWGDNAFYRFDLRSQSWTRLPDPNIAPPLAPNGSFSINGKGYVNGSPVHTPYKLTEVWEYTP